MAIVSSFDKCMEENFFQNSSKVANDHGCLCIVLMKNYALHCKLDFTNFWFQLMMIIFRINYFTFFNTQLKFDLIKEQTFRTLEKFVCRSFLICLRLLQTIYEMTLGGLPGERFRWIFNLYCAIFLNEFLICNVAKMLHTSIWYTWWTNSSLWSIRHPHSFLIYCSFPPVVMLQLSPHLICKQ